MASIGIMGGTFNPIHIGHIEIAKAAYRQYYLDEVWFMPNHIPAYKSEDMIVSGADRLAMVELAIQDISYFKASDFELKREGNTYTAETMERLNRKYPEETFYFIMGADSLFYFDKWKNAEIILQYATLLAAPRDEKSICQMKERIRELNIIYGGDHFHLIECPEIPCSSSKIRQAFYQNIKNDMLVDNKTAAEQLYLPDLVYNYIVKKKLYRTKG